MTGKVKIALCLSGEPRSSMASFPYIYESLINLGPECEVDVYIHSWKNFRTLKLYNPKRFLIDNRNEEQYFREWLYNLNITSPPVIKSLNILNQLTVNSHPLKNPFLMFSSIKNCFDLIQEPYDYYIRARYDLLFKSKFYIESILSDISENKYDMLIPYEQFTYKRPNEYNDQLSIGTYKSMEVYSGVFNYLEEIINKTNSINPQVLLKYWLDINKVKVNSYHVDWTLVRKTQLLTINPNFNFLDQ
tara:strand:+ start:943 stop:1680 length:738 start_codon:yes stop_codon:yes gene_type:complete